MYMLYICLLAPLIQNGFSLIGEEIDLNSLSNYDSVDDLNEASEIWNTENDDGDTIIVDSISRQLLENICENTNTRVYLTEEDITIDCKTYNKDDLPIENVKSVVKRSADEPEQEVEGSGDGGEEQTATEDANEENQEVTTEAEVVEETEESNVETTEAEVEEQNVTEETNVETTEAEVEEQNVTEETNVETTEAEVEEQNATEETNVETTEVENTEAAAEEEQPEITTEEVEDTAETTTTTIIEEATENPEEVANNDETATENIPEEPAVVPTTVKSDEVADNAIGKEENQPNNNNQEAKETESETIPDSDKPEQRNKTGRNLVNPQTHSNVSDDSVKTDGSTENPKKAGSKDTTILVVLFVAVVVVGVAAFAYNFIKKRKQRAADLETVERSSIKRSLQNLTKMENGEPEKKPLIGDNKEVEMVEMKKESTALKENGESLPSEETEKKY